MGYMSMTSNTHMPNLNFILLAIFDIFSTKCDDDAGPIGDPLQLSDPKLLQP